MLPRVAVRQHHHPLKRAKILPKHLLENNADIIVFQEAFDGVAMQILRRKLKKTYPHWLGFKNKFGIIYSRAGGIIMCSKYPIKEIESIRYKDCTGVDCSGRKGALLAEVDYPAQKFQVLGTHIQAGGPKEIKRSQFEEVGALLKKHEQQGIPQFAAKKKITLLTFPLC